MKRRTKIISAVTALAILVCVFAVLATSFAADTSSESASFRVDAQIMGYNRVEVKIYAPAGAAGGSYTLKYDSSYLKLIKPDADKNGEQSSVTSYENGGTAITNYNFSQDSLRCSAAAPKSSSTEQLYGSYTFYFDGSYKEGSISVIAFDIYSGDETPKLLGSDKTAKCDFDVKAAPFNTTTLIVTKDGTWLYMENGKHNTDYTGLVNYYNTWYYVENGVLDWSYTGPTEYDGTTYFVTNSTLDENYSSLVLVDGVWHYVENGVYSNDYTGLTLYYGTWYYVENGVLNWDYTGLTLYYGTWYYVENGVLNWNYTGSTEYYGTTYYVINGILDWDYSSLVYVDGVWHYVEKGVYSNDYTGLTLYYGTWYYVEDGILDWEFEGLTDYYGTLYYVKDGVLHWDFSGFVVDEDYNIFYVENGAVDRSLNGLYNYYDHNWCYLADGQVVSSYTGLFNYYGTWYYLEEGFLNWYYYGLTNYYGTYYGVEGGILDWNFTGALRYGTSLYYVSNGVFDSSFNGEAEYCTGKIYNFKDGVSVDYDGYVADAAQLVKLIVYCELKDDTEIEIISAQGLPDFGPYGGVAVTFSVKHNDGTEDYRTYIATKSYFETPEFLGVRENIGDGTLFVTERISCDFETENSVSLTLDDVVNYFNGINTYYVLNENKA